MSGEKAVGGVWALSRKGMCVERGHGSSSKRLSVVVTAVVTQRFWGPGDALLWGTRFWQKLRLRYNEVIHRKWGTVYLPLRG